MEKQKLNTYLPVFKGFYYAGLLASDINIEMRVDIEVERIFHDKDIEIGESIISDFLDTAYDYEKDKTETSKLICDTVEESLKELYPWFDSVEFQELRSPKYYNYSDDSIDCALTVQLNGLDGFKAYLLKSMADNRKEWADLLKSRYKSCDGFISYHEHDLDSWVEKVEKVENDPEHNLGALIDMLLIIEERSEKLYENIVYACNESDIFDSCVDWTKFDSLVSEHLETLV